MSNNENLRVYSIQAKGQIDVPGQGDVTQKTFYGLVIEQDCDSIEEGEAWVKEKGRNGIDYTILNIITK